MLIKYEDQASKQVMEVQRCNMLRPCEPIQVIKVKDSNLVELDGEAGKALQA